MICPSCGRSMAEGERFCQVCGWTCGRAPGTPGAAQPTPRKHLTVFAAVFVAAIVAGAGLGAFLWLDSISKARFTILDGDAQWTEMGDVKATVTVRNIGSDPGWVTVVCEVTFESDGLSYSNSEHFELLPDEELTVEIVVPLPSAYMGDDTGSFEIYLE